MKSMFGTEPDPPSTTTTITTTATTASSTTPLTTPTTTTTTTTSYQDSVKTTDTRETITLPTSITITKPSDFIHRSSSGDYCTNDVCDCTKDQGTHFKIKKKNECVDSYRSKYPR